MGPEKLWWDESSVFAPSGCRCSNQLVDFSPRWFVFLPLCAEFATTVYSPTSTLTTGEGKEGQMLVCRAEKLPLTEGETI